MASLIEAMERRKRLKRIPKDDHLLTAAPALPSSPTLIINCHRCRHNGLGGHHHNNRGSLPYGCHHKLINRLHNPISNETGAQSNQTASMKQQPQEARRKSIISGDNYRKRMSISSYSVASCWWLVCGLVTILLLHQDVSLLEAFQSDGSMPSSGCKFYPIGENRRFERVSENLPIGSEIFKLEVHPRSEFRIEPIDNSLSDVNYFKYVDIDEKSVAIKLNQSLEDLVDRRDPQNVLKFKLTCRGLGSLDDAFLPVTVYIQDVNDHAPEFQNVPYHLEVDELTPVGLTIFRSIHAIDRDKPNTANSDITYSIVGGNENDSFILSDPIEGILVINKALDYDHGNREFKIQIQASDHGSPMLSSVTTMTIKVKDADDQNPIFSHEVYTASVSESAQITGKRIREKVLVEPAILAFDQDTGINARLRYSIVLGNEGGFFEMNAQTGEIFLIREIDLERLTNPVLSLQIQASQVDNPFRQALARVDISVMDINDNSPEFEYDMYNITVIENLPPGFTVLQVFATDSDQGDNAQFKYVLHDESGAFKIDPNSGWISVKDPTKLDRETTDKIRMHVTTMERKPNVNPDISKRKRGTSVEINLLDSNDNTPFFVGTTSNKQRTPNMNDLGDEDHQASAANCLNVTGGPGSDSDCVVPINLYNFNVLETAPPGTQVGHVYAYDRDLGDNGRVQYFKQNDSISLGAPFDVNPLNGSIYVLPQFTRLVKKQQAYTMFVKATDSAQIHFERRHSVAVVQINVTDINNSVPQFVGTTPFEAYVGESLPEGAFVTQIYAKDDDAINEVLEYSIVAGNDEKLFFMDSRSGKVYTAAVLDYERKQTYDLLIQVSDGVNTAVAPLIVNIIDINDQQPQFSHQFYNFSIVEEQGPNLTVGAVQALDRDSGKNAHLTYLLVGEQAQRAFHLDPQTGHLRTRRSLDCEQEANIDFVVLATDGGIPQLTGTTNVRVRVDDLNDWAPKFEQQTYEVEVQEELEAPVDVLQIKAHDKDRDENAIIKYLLVSGNEDNLFNINADTGLISTAGRLNYEHKREHRLQVAARNVKPFQGPQAKSIVNPAVEVLVKVVDINDELVMFERASYHWRVSEHTGPRTILGRVNASNPSRGFNEQDIIYWLGPVYSQPMHPVGPAGRRMSSPSSNETTNQQQVLNKLWLDEKTGELALMEPLDRDPPANEQSFRLQVFARDRLSINKHNASAPMVIDVVDVNDNRPQFDERLYSLEMPENLPPGTTIPAFFKVLDLDSGLNGKIASYALNGTKEEMEIFAINNVTGTITLRTSLDYERQSQHRFELVATDAGQPIPLSGTTQVVIQVQNINEYSPKFINLPYEFTIQENAVAGSQVGSVRAQDQDGNRISYSMSDGDIDFFQIEPTSGKIYVARQLVPRTQYSFIVRATDDGQPQNYSLGVQVLIRVRDTNDFAPVFTSNSYRGQVIEKRDTDKRIVKVEAQDKDLQNNTITYSIVGGNDDGIFIIDKRSGEIRIGSQQGAKLDYDKRKQYTMLIQASDSHENPLFGLTMVTIDVIDQNDHAPVFSKSAYSATVMENAPLGTCFFKIEADSRDTNDPITYSIAPASGATLGAGHQPPSGSASGSSSSSSSQQAGANGSTSGNGVNSERERNSNKAGAHLFEIHPQKGTLCSRAHLDREQRATYEFTVTANDGRFESQAPITVEIMDENDNRPQFDQDHYQITIPFDSQPGRSIIHVHAQDPDSGANGLVQYWIKNTHGLFQIDAKTGQVRLVTRLPNSAQNQTFEMRIFAQDQGISPLIGEATLMIRSSTTENHAPKFERFSYQVSVDENLAGIPLLQVQASDPDPGKAGKIVYRIVKLHSTTTSGHQMVESDSNSSMDKNGATNNNKRNINGRGTAGNGPTSTGSKASQSYLRSAFKIDKSSGKIMLLEPLDYEETRNVEIVVEARDEAISDSQSTTTVVQVQVLDVNDNRPEFLAMPKLLRIPSSTQPNSEIIYTVQAIDGDSNYQGNNEIDYRLEPPSMLFAIHPQTGQLYASQPLPQTGAGPSIASANGGPNGSPMNVEGTTFVQGLGTMETLSIVASDRSPTHPLMSQVTLDVEIYRDQGDDAHPVFNSNQYFVQSDNAIEPGTTVLIPRATTPNGDPVNYNITLVNGASSGTGFQERSLSAGHSALQQQQQIIAMGGATRNMVKRFAIDSETGKISTTSKLEPSDISYKNIYHFIVKATNRNKPELYSEAGVIVRLWDTNSRCPRFPFSEYYASVAESARIDSVVVANLVIDDVERFAGQKLSYQITEDNSNDNFFIDVMAANSNTNSNSNSNNSNQTGAAGTKSNKISVSLRVKKPLDRESMPKFLGGIYTLTVTASNQKCSALARIKILIDDQNDNSPTFDKPDYFVDLKENTPVGHVVTRVSAQDLDELDEGKLRYAIAEGSQEAQLFEMETKTGVVSVKQEIDREKAPAYVLRVMAIDTANNTGWTNLHIQVQDENDWAPTFLNDTFFMNVTEGPTSVGTRIRLPVFDYDDGLNRQMEVYIVEGNAGGEFRLDVDEGGPLLTTVQELDREKYANSTDVATHTVYIAAKDKGIPARVGRTQVVIYIHDINDNAPKFTHENYYEFIEENAPVGSVVATIRALDADSPNNTNLTYSFVRAQVSPPPTIDSSPPPTSGVRPGGQSSSAGGSGFRPRQLRGPTTPTTTTTTSQYNGQSLDNSMLFRVRRRANLMEQHQPRVGEEHLLGQTVASNVPSSKYLSSSSSLNNNQISTNGGPPFMLDPITGVVNVSRQLDISEQQQYIIKVEAYDGLWRTQTQLRIFINEVEDPRDVSARSSEATNHYRFQVMENQADSLVGQVDLKPRKLRVNAQIRYQIVNSEMRNLFKITQNGEIYTIRGLDREQRAQYAFTVMLEEKRATSKLTVAEVIVEVLDENDEMPAFHHVYYGSIKENSPPGTQVFVTPANIEAVDRDTRNNSRVRYLLSGVGSERFTVLTSGVVIYTPAEASQVLDRELKSEYKLDVTAIDNGNLSSKTSLTIKIEDENDSSPIFETGPLYVLIPETAKPGSKVVQVRARDMDEIGPNSEIHYSIISGASDDIRIDALTGEMFVVGQLTPATIYNINVSAIDGGGLSARTQVNVTVVDVNDHRPTFEKANYQFVVIEGNYSRGALKLGSLKARDEDIGKNGLVEYLLVTDPQYDPPMTSPMPQPPPAIPSNQLSSQSQANGGQFPLSIDVHTGELFARGFIDREQRDTYLFKVMALDMGEPALNSTCEVVVKVKDINDEVPRFYTDPYLALVPENLDPGHKVTQIAAFDPDSGENGQVFYKLGDGHDGKFYIDGKDGTVWTLASLDYEQKNFYNITIVAYDRGSPSLSSTAKLWITVADMNDAVPNFAKAVYTLEVAENAKLGDTIFVLNAGKGAFKYSWSSGPGSDSTDTFTIEPNSGHIKLAQPLDSVQRNHYRLLVRAQDESDPPKFDTAEINILVGTGQGVRLFAQRLYEVNVLENQLAPLVLLDLNSTDEMIHQPVQYSIVGTDHRGLFRIEPDTGRLSVLKSLDRERRDSYTVKIKAETGNLNVRQKRDINGRWSASTLTSTAPSAGHPPGHELPANFRYSTHLGSVNNLTSLHSYHLAYDETFVSITVEDENDCAPVFTNKNKPIVAAIPLEASFGYEIARVTAKDMDIGLNAVIKYEIVSRGDDASSKFYIDSATGVVRSMVNFALDNGRLYNFDVRATDRDGAENGNSASTPVFVYVLPETKMVLMVTDTEPIVMEKRSLDVISYLSNVTGFEVKMAKLEPHMEGESPEPFSTDMFLYAVNPSLNNIVDTETLLNVFRQSSQTILSHLHQFKIRRIQGVTVQEKISQMGATEIAIIALSSVIFLGSILAIVLLCSTCKAKKSNASSSQQSLWEQQQRIYSLKNPLMQTAAGNKVIGSVHHQTSGPITNAYMSGRDLAIVSQMTNGHHSNSTYSTGDGANSSEYVDSLISYKRSSGSGNHAKNANNNNNNNSNNNNNNNNNSVQVNDQNNGTGGSQLIGTNRRQHQQQMSGYDAMMMQQTTLNRNLSQMNLNGTNGNTSVGHQVQMNNNGMIDIRYLSSASSSPGKNQQPGATSVVIPHANITVNSGLVNGGGGGSSNQDMLMHHQQVVATAMGGGPGSKRLIGSGSHITSHQHRMLHGRHPNEHHGDEDHSEEDDDVSHSEDDDDHQTHHDHHHHHNEQVGDEGSERSAYSGTSWSSDRSRRASGQQQHINPHLHQGHHRHSHPHHHPIDHVEERDSEEDDIDEEEEDAIEVQEMRRDMRS